MSWRSVEIVLLAGRMDPSSAAEIRKCLEASFPMGKLANEAIAALKLAADVRVAAALLEFEARVRESMETTLWAVPAVRAQVRPPPWVSTETNT